MNGDPVVVSITVAGRILQAAGLAAWVLAKMGENDAAHACGEIQEVIDAVLSTGRPLDVAVPREVALRAVDLWDAAAGHLAGVGEVDPEAERRAGQLHRRSADLRSRIRS